MSIVPQTPDKSHDQRVAKVAKLIADTQVCMFTTTDTTGRLVSRPMAVLEVEFDGDLWFVSKDETRKVNQVRHGAHVNVAFASKNSWVSVAGDAEIVRDVDKAKELWSAGVSAWFPEGPEAPGLVLVKVHADCAEYWETPSGVVVTSLLSFIKGRVTGEPYSVENETISF